MCCAIRTEIFQRLYTSTATANLYVAASDESLASCESEFNAEIGKESILFERFAGHASEYDFVIMDLPPHLAISNGECATNEPGRARSI